MKAFMPIIIKPIPIEEDIKISLLLLKIVPFFNFIIRPNARPKNIDITVVDRNIELMVCSNCE